MEIERYLPVGFKGTSIRYYTSKEYFNETTASVGVLGRTELTRRIGCFKGKFKLDFTEDYLNSLSVNRLRHILLAALINAKPRDQRNKTNTLDNSL